MRKRKKLQKIELMPVERPERIAAWLNAAPVLPALSKTPREDTNAFIATVKLFMEDVVLYEVFRFVREGKEVPAQIRMNPWSIFEMHTSRWHLFPFWYQGRTMMIPVVADPRVSPSRVHCVGNDETMLAVRAVRP
jgi:hypothetical protein